MAKRNNRIHVYLLVGFLLCVFIYLVYCLSHSKHNTEKFTVSVHEKELDEFSMGKSDHSSIPNIIWTFWEGDNNIVVNKCIESWKYYNPGYDIRILNKSNYSRYIDVNIDSIPHSKDFTARYSDYIRCLVLAKYGGFWIDASIICHHPFSWVHGVQNNTHAELVGYYIGDVLDNKYPVIENWFFACVPGSVFMNDWSDEFLSTQNHKTIQNYLDHVDSQQINTSKVQSPEYLTMHISAQKILQKNSDKYRLCLFKAESGPFYYLSQSNWDNEQAIKHLTDTNTCANYYKFTFIKLRGSDRHILEKYDTKTMDNAFSNIVAPRT